MNIFYLWKLNLKNKCVIIVTHSSKVSEMADVILKVKDKEIKMIENSGK